MKLAGSAMGRTPVVVASVLIAAIVAMALARSASTDMSVTIDEFGYVPDGLGWLSGAQPRVADGNPPFFKMISALPVAASSHVFDPDWIRQRLDFWTIGRLFSERNRTQYHDLLMRARIVPVLFLGLTCALAGILAWRIYGPSAAILAAWLTAVNPNLLAHGALVTPDIFFTAGLLAFLVTFDWYAGRPSYARAATLGAMLGVACLFKLSGIIIVLVLWLWSLVARHRAGERGAPSWTDTRFRVTAAVSLWLIIAGAYGFEGVGTRLRDVNPRPTGLSGLGPLANLPAPLPVPFLSTLEFQLAEEGYIAYLDGQVSTSGFWDYYLRALAYKTPPALLLLTVLATLARRVGTREGALLVIGSSMLTTFSVLGLKNIGVRYVLFLYPLMAIWCGRLLAAEARRGRQQPRWICAAVCLGLVGAAISEWRIWPHHLAYFSALAGGPVAGPQHLVDSNVD